MARTAADARERLMEAVIELIWTGSYGHTSIDRICERAGVKKGSFYYFFESKAALAQKAIEAGWNEYRVKLDPIFSPTLPPLERLRRYCEFEYEEQMQLKHRHGYVLGCPLCTLGSEISTLEAGLRQTVHDIMDQSRLYFEAAIRDAHEAGVIRAPDPVAKSRTLYAYVEGLFAQARIRDDIEILREMESGIRDILGIGTPAQAAA